MEEKETSEVITPPRTQTPWRSENINELCKALAAFQSKVKTPKKTKTANVRSKKGEESSFSYQYADLADVLEAINAAGPSCGLSYSQILTPNQDGKLCIITVMMHTSGQWLQSEYRLPPASDNRDMGGNITYGRRYTIAPLFGLASDDDTDHAGDYGTKAEKDDTPPPPQIPRGPRKNATTVEEKETQVDKNAADREKIDAAKKQHKEELEARRAEKEAAAKAKADEKAEVKPEESVKPVDATDDTRPATEGSATDPAEYNGLDPRLCEKLKEYENMAVESVVVGFKKFVASRKWFGDDPDLTKLPNDPGDKKAGIPADDFVGQIIAGWQSKVEKDFLKFILPF